MADLVTLSVGKMTDKNTVHSYLPLYDELLINIKDTAKNAMEIGIWDGGSIALWAEYFPNATVYGLDVSLKPHAKDTCDKYGDRVKTMICDAYSTDTLQKLSNTAQFDFILDDGPHTLESMKYVAEHYSQLLSPKGILIIEDVQNIGWVEAIKAAFPQELQQYVQVFDLRKNKGRYDDIVVALVKK